MDINEFLQIWDHILILLSPINKIVSYTKENSLSLFFLKIIKNNHSLFFKISLSSLFFMIVTIFSSFYFQIVVSCVQNGKDNQLIKAIVFSFLILILFKVILEHLKNYYLNYLTKNIDITIFTNFFEHIFHLPLNFIQNRTTGEIISRVQELSEIKEMAIEIFTNFLLNAILIFGAIVALFLINSQLFFCLCFIIGLYFIIGLLFSKIIYKKIKQGIEYSTDLNTTLVEYVDMISSIKHLHLISEFLYHLEHKLILMLKNQFHLNHLLNRIETGKSFIYELGLFIITTYGIYLISLGKLELLSLVTFNSLLIYLFNPIKELIALVPRWSFLKASFQKLTDFLNIKKEEEKETIKEIQSVKVENLTYSYNQLTNVLENINFEIKKGDKVLLVGPSGCGKSTICKILARDLKEYSGIIKMNNVNEKDKFFQKPSILYVGQNEKLFTGTIQENIFVFRKIKEKDLIKIAKICQLEEIINKRPNRYQTLINASLNNLSGGEKQRIILARSLLSSASVIILDEALSEVNLELEKKILENIFENFKEKTLIYVTHKNVLDKFRKVIKIC